MQSYFVRGNTSISIYIISQVTCNINTEVIANRVTKPTSDSPVISKNTRLHGKAQRSPDSCPLRGSLRLQEEHFTRDWGGGGGIECGHEGKWGELPQTMYSDTTDLWPCTPGPMARYVHPQVVWEFSLWKQTIASRLADMLITFLNCAYD